MVNTPPICRGTKRVYPCCGVFSGDVLDGLVRYSAEQKRSSHCDRTILVIPADYIGNAQRKFAQVCPPTVLFSEPCGSCLLEAFFGVFSGHLGLLDVILYRYAAEGPATRINVPSKVEI